MSPLSIMVNSAGLVFDIVGVVVLWRYGLPSRVNRGGASYLTLEDTDQAQVALEAHLIRASRIGLALIVLGFALQLASNFL